MRLRAIVLVVSVIGLHAPNAIDQPATSTNSIGMEFVLIQPGEMVVGKFEPPYPKPADAALARRIETMVTADYSRGFVARIDRPYYIGKYEVTQGQWKRVMGNNPPHSSAVKMRIGALLRT